MQDMEWRAKATGDMPDHDMPGQGMTGHQYGITLHRVDELCDRKSVFGL